MVNSVSAGGGSLSRLGLAPDRGAEGGSFLTHTLTHRHTTLTTRTHRHTRMHTRSDTPAGRTFTLMLTLTHRVIEPGRGGVQTQ